MKNCVHRPGCLQFICFLIKVVEVLLSNTNTLFCYIRSQNVVKNTRARKLIKKIDPFKSAIDSQFLSHAILVLLIEFSGAVCRIHVCDNALMKCESNWHVDHVLRNIYSEPALALIQIMQRHAE